MHKAKIFLLTVFSLTMLFPLSSSMNTSFYAIAIEEDLYPDMTTGGGVDYSQYDRFYKDDNFRENYYNFHKQQHQHQPQQSGYDNNDYNTYEIDKTTKYVNDMADYVEEKYQPYANDNNYVKSQNSDFVKKIKCNNINSNLNGIKANIGSNNPLGIGAESLQGDDASTDWFGNGKAHNGNFDLDCINNNENTPINGNGGTGPVGPKGPPGPTQITAAKIYKQFGPIVNAQISPGGLSANSTASCLLGDTVLSGGYHINATFPIGTTFFAPLNFTLLETEATSAADGWTTEAEATTLFSVQSIAQCFDNSP
jgi:hypothetical protein